MKRSKGNAVTGIPHGEAVSAGMLVASRLSVERSSLPPEDADRIEGLLRKLKLPTRLQFDKEKVLDAMKRDKKRKGDSIEFVLLDRIGSAFVEKISIHDLEKVVKEMR